MTGVDPPSASETAPFYAALDRYLVPFSTSDWLEDTPGFLSAGVLDAIRTLRPGETLCEKYPRVWPTRSATGPASSIPRSVASSPATAGPTGSSPASSSQPSRLSPLVLPAVSRTPSLNSAAPSPASGDVSPQVSARPDLPGPLVESAPRRGRSAARSAYRQPAVSASEEVPSSAPVPDAPPVGPSSVPPRTSKKRPIDVIPMEVRPPGNQWKSCQYCSHRRQRCAPPKGAKPPFTYPCAACKHDKVECVPPSSSSGPGTFSFAPVGCLNIRGPLVGPDRPPRPVRATRARTSAKRGESSIRPAASNIAAVLSKASEFRIEIRDAHHTVVRVRPYKCTVM